jgi:hypothetical protein
MIAFERQQEAEAAAGEAVAANQNSPSRRSPKPPAAHPCRPAPRWSAPAQLLLRRRDLPGHRQSARRHSHSRPTPRPHARTPRTSRTSPRPTNPAPCSLHRRTRQPRRHLRRRQRQSRQPPEGARPAPEARPPDRPPHRPAARLGGQPPLLLDNRLRLAIQDSSSNRPAYEAAIRRLEPEMDRLVASPSLPPALSHGRQLTTSTAPASSGTAGRKSPVLQARRRLAAEDERRFGGDDNNWRSQALAWKYAAGLFPAGTEEAYKYIQRALPLDRKRVALNPANAQARLDLTFDQSAAASYYLRAGRLAEARDLLLEISASVQLLVEIDPANQWYRNRSGIRSSGRPATAPSLKTGSPRRSPSRIDSLAASHRPPLCRSIMIPFSAGERVAASDPAACPLCVLPPAACSTRLQSASNASLAATAPPEAPRRMRRKRKGLRARARSPLIDHGSRRDQISITSFSFSFANPRSW